MNKNLLDDIPSILLMGPGPSSVSPAVYYALSRQSLGHLDPYFIQIMDEIKIGLQQLMGTENALTVPLSGTGSSGMEAAFVNMVERGDKVLILQNGVFGMRMADVAGRLGAEVTVLEFPWGQPVDLDQVESQLRKDSYKIVAVVHAETSTGVRNPAREIGKLLRQEAPDSLYLLDAVTSLGGIPVEVDRWGADICYSGTQKCLSCPPGCSPISFSPRAVEMLHSRKTKVPNWYLDLTMLTQYWSGHTRVYHHTAPINMLYGLYQAVWNILDEGIEKAWARHQTAHELLVDGLEALGWEMLVEKKYRLPMLNTVKVPEGVDEANLRRSLLNDYRIEIGSGLGPLAGKIIRIGLMGYNAQAYNVDRLLQAMQAILGK